MPLHVRMAPEDPEEAHRPATPLELFLDLTFVVAIAQAASSLHHGLVDEHAGDAIFGFPLVFFAIWWAWMNFTWFASAYDTDDAIYRLAVFVQVAGVLVLAAGIPRAFDGRDFGIMTLGYALMRLALVGQWLRAAASHVEGRTTALRYAATITALQVGWLARLALPDSLFFLGFLPLLAGELLAPVWAEATSRTPWHPGHIAERYGLFTIIVLGESVLAATVGVQVALDADGTLGDLATVVVGGLVAVFAMWWLYFDMPAGQTIQRARQGFARRRTGAFAWGYGHYFVFVGAAAAGAGLAVAVDHATGRSGLTDAQAGLTVTVPVTVYVLAVWALHYRDKQPSALHRYAVPIAAALILAASVTPEPVLATGTVLAGLVALGAVVTHRRERAVTPEGASVG